MFVAGGGGGTGCPTNTRHRSNVGVMLGYRRLVRAGFKSKTGGIWLLCYTVPQTVEKPGLCRAAYDIVHYNNLLL